MKIIRFAALSLTGLALLTALPASAIEGTYEIAIKKQEEKKQSRWSLADWLVQKQKNRMMDLWLAKNSTSSSFEFFLEAQSINYGFAFASAPEQKFNHNAYGASLAAYAGIAGLRGSYEGDGENRTTWSGSLNLRLFGRALQDTHLNLEYGLRGTTLAKDPTPAETFQNQMAGATLNLYLTKHLGLEGGHRKILKADSNQNRSVEGESTQAGVFIDFSLLRVFGTWRKEVLKLNANDGTPSTEELREGFGGGLRIFF